MIFGFYYFAFSGSKSTYPLCHPNISFVFGGVIAFLDPTYFVY